MDLNEFKLGKVKIAGQKKRVSCALVLLRHGQSHYNLGKIFTGWADPDLTNRGREEARLAGQLLKATGVKRVEIVYTSLLKRAVKTVHTLRSHPAVARGCSLSLSLRVSVCVCVSVCLSVARFVFPPSEWPSLRGTSAGVAGPG